MKFEECTHVYEERRQKLGNAIAHEEAEIQLACTQSFSHTPSITLIFSIVKSIEELTAEHSRLTSIVEVQNLSPEEVLRMNTEHETLSSDLRNLKNKITESTKTINKLEVSVGKKMADAEEAIDNYNGLLTVLGLFPPLPPPLEGVNLGLVMNSAAADPRMLLQGPDIADVVKPSLAIIAEQKRDQHSEVENEKISVDNELDQVVTACENLEEEEIEVSKKAQAINDQAEDLRDVSGISLCLGNMG